MRFTSLFCLLLIASLLIARGGGGCFLPGTLVKTPDGEIPIEKISVGNQVISTAADQLVVSKVSEIYQVERDYYYRVITDQGSIDATAEHPFSIGNGRFVETSELKTGDTVFQLRDDGTLAPSTINSVERFDIPTTAYNLRVNGPHTFFANDFSVHNKGCFLAGTRIETGNGTVAIEQIRPGDEVLGFENGSIVRAKVSDVYSLERDHYYSVETAEGIVYATAEHPFYIGNGRFAEIGTLSIGSDIYVLKDGALIKNAITKIEKIDKATTVYNLQVDSVHTFFANGFAVHNKGGCFTGNTVVNCPDGEKPISQIVPGDRISSFDAQGRIVETTVQETFKFQLDEYYIIQTEKGQVNVTAEHPFYTDDGFVNAEDLHVGDIIYRAYNTDQTNNIGTRNATGLVKDRIVGKTLVQAPITAYNIRAGEPNTFFANGFAVHNKGGCFLAGTQVMTPTGSKSIESMNIGDQVISFDGNRLTVSKVENIYGVERDYYYTIETDSGSSSGNGSGLVGSVRATAEHPFYVGDGKYVEARNLTVGDTVYRMTKGKLNQPGKNEPARITKITRITQKVKAYNLHVSTPNTFFANGFAVHNKGGGFGGGGSSGSSDPNSCWSTFILGLVIYGILYALGKGGGKGGEWSSTTSIPQNKVNAKAKKVSALLAIWGRADQAWDESAIRDRASKTFLKLQECWGKRDYTEMKDLMIPVLYNQHVAQLESMKRRHEINKLEGLKLLDLQIILVSNYHGSARDSFTSWIKATAKDTIIDDRTNKKIRGDIEMGVFEELWTFERDIDAGAWKLLKITQPEEGMGIINAENFDYISTAAGVARVEEKAGGPATKDLGVSPTREQTEGAADASMDKIKWKAGRVSRLLNFLADKDKTWKEEDLKTQVRNLFIRMNTALETNDISSIKRELDPTFFEMCQEIITQNLTGGQHIEKRNLCVRDVEIVLVRNYYDNRKDEFTAWVSGQAQTVLVDEKSERIISGDTHVKDYEDFWTFKRGTDGWILQSIERGFRSAQIVEEENFDEGSGKFLMEWYYKQDRAL